MKRKLSHRPEPAKPLARGARRSSGQHPAWLAAGLLALAPAAARAEEAPPRAFTLDASALVDVFGVVSGGVERGTRVVARADLTANYDGSAGALPWLSAQVNLAAINGKSISALAGDVQGLSNIEFARTLRVVNAWAQLRGRHAALKLGIVDSNLDFDEQTVGASFIHSSHGMGPELGLAGLAGGAANPATSLGLVASVFDDAAGWKLRAGVFNGRPSDPDHPGRTSFTFNREIGVLAIGEADWTRDWGRIAIGGWHFTSKLPAIDGSGDRRGASGGFVTIEPNLINREGGLQLKGWLRAGLGDARTGLVRNYLGGGLVATGWWQAFPEDALGFAIARAGMSDQAGPGAGAETSFEWTFQHKLAGPLFVQPDVQWIRNPGGFGGTPDALVIGVRLILAHGIL